MTISMHTIAVLLHIKELLSPKMVLILDKEKQLLTGKITDYPNL